MSAYAPVSDFPLPSAVFLVETHFSQVSVLCPNSSLLTTKPMDFSFAYRNHVSELFQF